MKVNIVPIFNGKVENGKLWIANRKGLDRYLLSLKGDVQITIKKKKKFRSNNQNSYYWGVVIALISDHTGQDPESIHNYMAWKFLKVYNEKLKGFTVRSTTSLSTGEMEQYLVEVRQAALEEFQMTIPLPNEVAA